MSPEPTLWLKHLQIKPIAFTEFIKEHANLQTPPKLITINPFSNQYFKPYCSQLTSHYSEDYYTRRSLEILFSMQKKESASLTGTHWMFETFSFGTYSFEFTISSLTSPSASHILIGSPSLVCISIFSRSTSLYWFARIRKTPLAKSESGVGSGREGGAYGTISSSSSFLTTFTRSSRLTLR